MGLLLEVAGAVLVAAAAATALVLPGADANAEFTLEGWAWIVGGGLTGTFAILMGYALRHRR